ncbi:peroxidase 70-like [Nymphaea colorata]|nr:peroxidase 70-like [Nymphaea colorata]
MAIFSRTVKMILVMGFLLATAVTCQQLSPSFYRNSCPQALAVIRNVVSKAVAEEPRMGASLLRLHFHDCFVNGCDGSVLLDDTPTFSGEKSAHANMGSTRGFDVIDKIKTAVDAACGGAIVSCADILAVAARDSVVLLGGPSWTVQLGRRDSRTASKDAANHNLPSPAADIAVLLSNFQSKGLDAQDLVALSGAHTIGLAQCRFFRNRIYNGTSMNPLFLSPLQSSCPAAGGDDNTAPLDVLTPMSFDTAYYANLLLNRGLLPSDQALLDGDLTSRAVRQYSLVPLLFSVDFTRAMVKLGNISPLTGTEGEIRQNCRKIN